MGEASTILTSVQKGDLWRVQIAWPNGTTKYFGRFRSEQEASGWISAHRWLTERVIEDTEIRRKRSAREAEQDGDPAPKQHSAD
jgi:hypothetical protein